MEITSEEKAEERRREHWKLLSSLKTTVEGLVSSSNPNVWSRYGGLQRLHKDMNHILSHGLKHEQVYYKQKDYWPFVWRVRSVSPHLASHVEQFSKLEPVLSSGLKSVGEGYKAERWLLHSLQVHLLSAQLRPLLKHQGHTSKYYNVEAFLLSEPHVTAMFQCLEAVEQNNPRLLALVNTVKLSTLMCSPYMEGLLKSQSLGVLPGGGWRSGEGQGPPRGELNHRLTTSQCSLLHRDGGLTPNRNNTGAISESNSDSTPAARASGAPWGCVGGPEGDGERGMSPPPGPSVVVPSIALTEPASPCPAHSDAVDSGEGDYDDGPEYLAIGNLGHRSNRRDSQSSTPGGDPCGGESDGEIQVQSPGRSSLASVPPPTPRRSSFSEGQREPGRGGSRGHVRSMSDTGINSKHRHGEHVCAAESLVAEDCRLEDYSPFSLGSSDGSTPSSLYMESNGSQYSSVPDCMFRKPLEGQSLISYLSEQDFGSCADLEKENAHFSISESLIAAIELMKCNLRRRVVVEDEEEGDDSDSEIRQLKQKIRLRRRQIQRTRLPPSQRLFHSTDSGCSRRSSQDSFHLSNSGSAEEVEECELKDGCEGQSLMAVSKSVSLSHASLFSDADIKRGVTSSGRSFLRSESISPSFLQSNSAESVAMGLLRQFEGMQLPAASELDWLVPEQDAPQKLLPIPDSLPISPDDGEHADIYKLRIRVRGNLEWAPPRPQIIFNIHPAPKRKIVVAKQNYRCAGCGTRIDPDYIKRMRYCEYLGRYFCQCCHENAQAVVPGRVLRKWDFSKYYVSNFARDLLGKISGDPLFNPNDINNGLYKKTKALETVRVLRVQLFHMKNLFKTCRLARDVLDQFDSLPGHLTEDLHLFSLSDLNAVRNGELAPRLRELLKLGSAHVAGCVLCQAKGFVCEFCGNDKDIIFPFQLNKCTCCEECKACFHSKCFQAGKECPRCQRLAERRERMARKNMEEQEDKEEDEGGGS
ncbi:run domain Beclin-1-interacting and cysteine-rich domain-containing protein isoform X4 [Oncorhynchus tshawytscha]|uniref:run domain Beclin-1-interacting and cysteine-rich domain-containing protein isoform X4 n=1 Tax=Oncorhynchus tshawytscha TaxID=74940 RepID=UPI001C3D3BB9|nr:run domain Beclin-1-interacting and cysteine-rich domain-containing protein isoform X4 [Oncorhynchus tshawytscha]